MKLCDICIRRPVFATVLSLILILFGWIGFESLEIRYFPDVEQKVANISYSYQGASADYMANQVTRFVEGALQGVDGITQMTSSSSVGSSSINLILSDDANIVKVMGDIQNAISSINPTNLPADMQPPSISFGGVDRPALLLSFTSKTISPTQMLDYVDKNITPKLTKVPGMGAIWHYGASTYALRIWLDPQKMAAYGVTVTDVKTVLNNNNIDFSAGSIIGKQRNFSFQANTRLSSVDQFKNLIVKEDGNQILRLKNIAKIQLGTNSLYFNPMTINGVKGITLELRPRKSANPITVSKETIKVINQIKKNLPKSINAEITYNQSTFLMDAIKESAKTLIEAIILVIIIIYLFLGSIRATIIPVATIPVCVISVFGLMKLFGFTINVITLLAIILAIGLVVDDAIVMLENIHRHIEEGMKPKDAAFKGSKEIGFSVIAMTITLAAVYAPTGFMTGVTAGIFREFAFTLAGAVIISGFVALTLSPMMCAYFLTSSEKEPYVSKVLNIFFNKLMQAYKNVLDKLIKNWWIVIVLLVVLGIFGYGIYKVTPQTFIPAEDIGYFQASVTYPPSSSLGFREKYSNQLNKIYATTPGIAFNNNFTSTSFVSMKPWQKRKSTQEIIDEIRPKLDALAGVIVDPNIPPPISYGGADGGGTGLQVRILSGGSVEKLYKTMQKLVIETQKLPIFSNVRSNLKFNNLVWDINFQRDQMSSYSIIPVDVKDTINVLFAGKQYGNIFSGNLTYPVKVQMQKEDLSRFSSLNDVYVRSTAADAAMVPLQNLIKVKTAVKQGTIHHFNRMLSADLTATIAPGTGLGKITTEMESILKNNLSKEESFAYGGLVKQYIESSGTMLGLFVLSIVFIYLVLAAQFESFVDPFIILFTVPLCIISAIATLKITGGSINLLTDIGLITLVGLISKHGILITQFANENLKAGNSLYHSVKNAGVTRLRPIIMTTLAMVLGAIPLALATGPGSNGHSQIGWVIVGGMFFGTFFSLVVVPVAYYIFAPIDYKKRQILRELKAKKA